MPSIFAPSRQNFKPPIFAPTLHPIRPHIKLYLFTTLICLSILSYSAYIYNTQLPPSGTHCSFKNTFGFPCAGCGGSHAMQDLLHGKVGRALRENGLVVVVYAGVLWIISMIIYDVLKKKDIFYRLYFKVMTWLRDIRNSLLVAVLLAAWWLFHSFIGF